MELHLVNLCAVSVTLRDELGLSNYLSPRSKTTHSKKLIRDRDDSVEEDVDSPSWGKGMRLDIARRGKAVWIKTGRD